MKIVKLLVFCCIFIVGCSKSLVSEIQEVLKTEKARDALTEKVATSYVRGCMEGLIEGVEPKIALNPMAAVQAYQYCNNLAGRELERLKTEHQSAILGCVQALLNNNGVPTNDGQDKSLVLTCEEVVKKVEGLQKKTEPRPSPSPK